jgi:hypothetical protein
VITIANTTSARIALSVISSPHDGPTSARLSSEVGTPASSASAAVTSSCWPMSAASALTR